MMKTEITQASLPASWTVTELGDVLERITNGLTCVQEKEPPGIPITRIETISNGFVDFERVRYVRELEESKKERFLLRRGDILFSHINSDLHLGKTAVVTSHKRLLHGMNLLLLRTKRELLDPYYLHYLLNFYRRNGTFMKIAQHAVNQSSLNQKKINSLKIPLAPLNQQKRIVAEIEKQFSRLDEAVAILKHVKANLKRYKAAVLKAAVKGRLVETEAERARREGRSFETGEQLLQRILETRCSQWKGKGKYKELVAPDTTDLPKLPEGWVWASVSDLLREPLRNGHSAKATTDPNGLRAFTLSAVTEGDFSEANTKRTVANPAKVADLWAMPGDIYVERSNTPELVGTASLYSGPEKFAFIPDLLIRIRVCQLVVPRYVELALQSDFGRRYFKGRAQGISGTMPKIDQAAIEAYPILLPPLTEQYRIVAEIDRRFSLMSKIEAQMDANLQHADILRQSILHSSFVCKANI
ncbi:MULTISPECIES: restriction endonuclease subunit S [Nitrosomonas]|uniref:Type I restriction enzyme S subunit n=1 Tax=Nitrosomonas communis TaxID=44574 RepID=A0A0F7KHC6_9PROT|nr:MULTISPECIES: restriction endonuclease subunit S [Nitrosomonas]AKH38264.1 hypothetical protein AAW31_11420 [Nitrosomonas communis]TYP89515.1 type I restriction enzyme S subunit [Nitrosomonas communis]UVS60247.1 restriction endonuclease subunit S [Nitrosomonas sp. PLL12]